MEGIPLGMIGPSVFSEHMIPSPNSQAVGQPESGEAGGLSEREVSGASESKVESAIIYRI
jgi:hypothetical protein